MNDIQRRRWDESTGLVIEQTLDGNIHISHELGNRFSQWTIDVDDGAVDLTSFKPAYAEEEIGPVLEQAGFDVRYPDPEQEGSLLGRIKTRITR